MLRNAHDLLRDQASAARAAVERQLMLRVDAEYQAAYEARAATVDVSIERSTHTQYPDVVRAVAEHLKSRCRCQRVMLLENQFTGNYILRAAIETYPDVLQAVRSKVAGVFGTDNNGDGDGDSDVEKRCVVS